ncbi:hypothetical protein CFHF_22230 [Caulobacter flavus]|uniref:PilZ domain-containing protein n=1 Tax=Caulobacter flavus TaxID=1679497 RepID=A0A2N5CNB8_9CAUL|nr:hypothetical protein [Caulobacter flavus]AYV46706.1 hypothetical protein C1707_10755 [Caulobacter flavus]PLR07943.1 hypothetical protein CFHF_22230 [Caulobacter flavus]
MNAPRPTIDGSAKVFENLEISLIDLFRAQLQGGVNMVSDRTFKNCRLHGPVVMLALEGVTFDSTNFGFHGGDIANLVLRPAGEKVIGALPFKDCAFIGCQFFAVGFTGPETFLQQILALETTQ